MTTKRGTSPAGRSLKLGEGVFWALSNQPELSIMDAAHLKVAGIIGEEAYPGQSLPFKPQPKSLP